ncbi:aldehyde dehydrogenase family protein [Nocardia miyunensis]|uniref:aldehyde dehydrogenase family protein n=1 Tax=Nocardia miyunensis TaxID=282684 RepID=UPI000AEE3ADF|nr:aldehyde dehydrogenase family protein [Nocardia miyunensis]
MTRTAQAHMTIGGRSVTTTESVPVINPATETAFAQAPMCARQQLDEAFETASAAQPGWAADDDARRAALHAAANRLDEAAGDIAPLLTAEQGKSISDSHVEIGATALWLRYYADLDVPREQPIQDDEYATVVATRRPLGVVAAITPWNFPLALAAWKMGPGLRAGNTMVLKPSPYTPLATLRLGEVLAEVLPPGVLNVVSGGDELGAMMSTHPLAAKVSVTGSVATGKAVARAAADDLKRITLELGGNDPAILLEDVDVDAIAEKLFWSAFANNGQVCGAVKRVYVPEALRDQVVAALAAIADGVAVGDGKDPGTVLGPVQNKPQFERVLGLLGDARNAGAQVVSGGQRVGDRGYFLRPTILAGVDNGVRVVDEEQFGPVLPVIPYRTLDEAVAKATSGPFGLGSSVWGQDHDRLQQVAGAMTSGTIWLNCHAAAMPNHPFGGARWSGIGVEGGLHGLHDYTQMHVVNLAKA